MVASNIQKNIENQLKVVYLKVANALLKELANVNPTILYRRPEAASNISKVSLSNASLVRRNGTYGQMGRLIKLKLKTMMLQFIFHNCVLLNYSAISVASHLELRSIQL